MFNRTAASRELDAKLLDRFAPLIQEELRRRVFEGAKGGSVAPETMKSALQDSFVYFFGRTRTEHERRTYQQMASRLLRLLAIDYMRSGGRISQVGVSFPVIERWITLMEAQDKSPLRLTDEQAAEVRRRLADRNAKTIPAEEVFRRFRSSGT